MQYQVPQFLDVEDKLIGPLTIKQFLYVLGGIGGGYLVWKLIPWGIVAFFPALLVLVLGGLLAFFKFNNKPFVYFVQSVIQYFSRTRMYVWQRREKAVVEEEIDLSKITSGNHRLSIPTSGGSGLADMSWKIDTHHDDVQTKKVNLGNDF